MLHSCLLVYFGSYENQLKERHRYVTDLMTSDSLASSISQQNQERERLRLAQTKQLVERCVCVFLCTTKEVIVNTVY